MAFEVYRVNRRFVWDGWQFAPKAGMHNQEFDALIKPNNLKTALASYPRDAAHFMKGQGCWDERACDPEFYGGDIWIVEENHPRKASILGRNKAIYDSGLRLVPVEELLEDETLDLKRLLSPPKSMVSVG